MPIISMFYGIIIRMYLLDSKHHNLPHIRARNGEFEASIGIEEGEILAGERPGLFQAGKHRIWRPDLASSPRHRAGNPARRNDSD
ncbi:MAG TPA: DUF4160 domain-containing protein [Methylococcus sp.]|nr:DUF4160 domain-containing protein [Methylococcus sp.]